MSSCLGNIQWRQAFNWSCFLLHILGMLHVSWSFNSHSSNWFLIYVTRFLECFMPVLRPPSTSFSILSLSNSHPSNRVLFALRASDRVHSENARPRVFVVVHGPALCVSSNSFDFFHCSSWRRDSILRPSERTPYVLPQDHDVLAEVVLLTCSN